MRRRDDKMKGRIYGALVVLVVVVPGRGCWGAQFG